MRWTPYMDDCLTILWDAQEAPLDRNLVLQVKLQLIVDEVARITLNGETSDLRVLHIMQAKILRSRFDDVMAQISPELQSDSKLPTNQGHNSLPWLFLILLPVALRTLVQATEISICSIGILNTTPTPPSSLPDTQRPTSLLACLQGIKAWLSTFLAIPPSKYILFSFALYAQLSQVIFLLYRLSTIEDPDWDLEVVRQEANVLDVLDQVIDRLSRVSREAEIICDAAEADSFSTAIKAIKYMRSTWESVLCPPTVGLVTPAVENLDEIMVQELNMDLPEGFGGWLTEGWSWDG